MKVLRDLLNASAVQQVQQEAPVVEESGSDAVYERGLLAVERALLNLSSTLTTNSAFGKAATELGGDAHWLEKAEKLLTEVGNCVDELAQSVGANRED